MTDFTPILEAVATLAVATLAVATLAVALITTFVVPYIKSKTTLEQQTQINAWVRIAVAAAEQVYEGPGKGDQKKAYVLTWLAGHGIAIDEDKLDAMIEAAVYELTKPPPNGELAEAMENLQKAEEAKKKLDREILAEYEEE